MKNTLIASFIALLLIGGAVLPASALTLSDIQSQIEGLLARISELKAQMNVIQNQTTTSSAGLTIATSPAQHRICALLNRNLTMGAQGEDVRGLQEFLYEQKILAVAPTGYFGTMTAEAVRRWQANEGVLAVGSFGPLSRERLKTWCGGGFSNEQRFNATPTSGVAPLTVTFSTWLSGFRSPSHTYVIDYGDGTSERAADCFAPADACIQAGQNAHTYTQNGIYVATLIEQHDPCWNQPACAAAVSSRVVGKAQIVVGAQNPGICTKEYKPVCGAKQVYCITTPCNPVQQTYSNECMMKADGSSLLYEGQCRADTDPSGDRTCRAWFDGCNNCARETPDGPAICTLKACFTQQPAYCTARFGDSSNKQPTISSFSGPTSLSVNQTGTWTVNASDPESGTLTYSVYWGDDYAYGSQLNSAYAAREFVQTTTFTHSYASSGTYTVTIIVRDNVGKEAKTTTTVNVTGGQVACTMEYNPVCGQPKMPECPTGYGCPMMMPAPQTYGNRCALNAAGAEFLYQGECRAVNACVTPWGSQSVTDGQTISSQPYFTNGQYTLSAVVALMRCSNGSWLRCDWQGNNCVSY